MARTSVIIPAHDVGPYIDEALRSVHGQTLRDIEVIVVDDGSRDATASIARQWAGRFADAGMGFALLQRPQGGAGAARNDGLDRAGGEFVCFVDADDRLHPEALETMVGHLEKHDSIDFAFPLCRHIDAQGRPIGVISGCRKDVYSAPDLLFDNPIHTGTGVTFRRGLADAAGRFDTGLPACIDLEYWIRVTMHRPDNIAVVNAVLVDYRIRPGQITGDWRRMRKGWEMTCERAEQAGLSLAASRRRGALARNALFWSTTAYKRGDLAAARSLALEFWRHDPRFALCDGHARIRTAACLASLLPAPVHGWLKSRFGQAAMQAKA